MSTVAVEGVAFPACGSNLPGAWQGRAQGRLPLPAQKLLRRTDYERAFAVLEACDTACGVPDFGERLVGALLDQLELRHVSFFSGPTFNAVFADPAPLTTGKVSKMLPEYRERWRPYDAFNTPEAIRRLASDGVASLTELAGAGMLPSSAVRYQRQFLGRWGVEAGALLRLDLPAGCIGLVGMFDSRTDKFDGPNVEVLRLLSKRLSAISRRLPASRQQTAAALLPERLRQVAMLVADGLSNSQIATSLSLTEDTVKKYVSRILSTTGCRSRMELALLARSWR